MCFFAGLSLLFGAGFVYNVFHRSWADAVWSLGIAAVFGAIAWVLGREEKESEAFAAFLGQNKERLTAGETLVYKGAQVSGATEVTQFLFCVSLIVLTLRLPSRYYIRAHHNTFVLGWVYSLITLVFGWWGIPWGPIYSIGSLFKNARGGDKRTIAALLPQIEIVETPSPAQPASAPASTPPPGTQPPSPWSS